MKDFQDKSERLHLRLMESSLKEQEAKTVAAGQTLASVREMRTLMVDEQRAKCRKAEIEEETATMVQQFTIEAIKDNRNPMN